MIKFRGIFGVRSVMRTLHFSGKMAALAVGSANGAGDVGELKSTGELMDRDVEADLSDMGGGRQDNRSPPRH